MMAACDGYGGVTAGSAMFVFTQIEIQLLPYLVALSYLGARLLHTVEFAIREAGRISAIEGRLHYVMF
jgi:hypothetical protein